jgi:hypothetical protein
MPRGRPRKNQRQQELPKNPLPITDTVTTNSSGNVVKEVSSETTKTEDVNKMEVEVETVNKGRPKKDDTPRCVCCKEPVYSGRRLNLSLLTTLASYHFAVEEMQPYICSRCASDLGEVVNKWLINHGAEVKPYYKPEYMAKNYDENLNNSNKNSKEDNSNG